MLSSFLRYALPLQKSLAEADTYLRAKFEPIRHTTSYEKQNL